MLGKNMALVQCKSKNQTEFDHKKLIDFLGYFVPVGVVKGWTTGLWDDRTSFQCSNEYYAAEDDTLRSNYFYSVFICIDY